MKVIKRTKFAPNQLTFPMGGVAGWFRWRRNCDAIPVEQTEPSQTITRDDRDLLRYLFEPDESLAS